MIGPIVDPMGRPVVDSTVRREAEEKLKDFISKNKGMFEDWVRQNGPVGFPIRYATDTKEWVWLEE